MTRKAFEAWIGNPPYERMCDRGSPESAWPGQYKNYEVQLAWEAWQAASKQQREKDAEFVRRGIFIQPEIQNQIAAAILGQGEE